MSYTDKIECPHCHKAIEVEVDIEGMGDDTYANINPLPPKGGESESIELTRVFTETDAKLARRSDK